MSTKSVTRDSKEYITIDDLIYTKDRSISNSRKLSNKMAYDEVDELPGGDEAREFYAKYEPKEVLGRGVSSTVRKVREKATGREYAAKIIDISCEKSTANQANELKQATKKEVNILRMCAGHKHIIELHDVFESPTFIFLVFELCKKGELFDYLTQVVTLSEKRTRIVMKQLLEAVAFCHAKNIAHRDLKPENILLDDEMNIKLSDFGFATVVTSEDELVDLCGTPGYLAPEILQVSMYDNAPGYGKAVDMWAIGVIMYTLLVGCPPFWHRKQMFMLRAIMEGNYKFGSPEWDDISDAPKDLISKLLVVDPTKRFSITEALQHPFITRQAEIPEEKVFYPKEKFKSTAIAVRALIRMRRLHTHPPPISIECVKTDPYCIKPFRKLIDGFAFKIYGHWVKRGEDQNRAALFENYPKRDFKKYQENVLKNGGGNNLMPTFQFS